MEVDCRPIDFADDVVQGGSRLCCRCGRMITVSHRVELRGWIEEMLSRNRDVVVVSSPAAPRRHDMANSVEGFFSAYIV